MSDFTHLHFHTHYSLLDGLGKIDDIISRVKELGMDSIAITDHGAMYGAIEFYQAATAAGIKPIIGLETYVAPEGHKERRGKPRHLTLIAQNMAGYKNLIQLTTKAHLQGYYYRPRIDYELLEKHSEGLIVLSGCLNSDLSKAITERRPDDADRIIKWHLNVFGPDRFYLEVQDHPTIRKQTVVNDALITFSKKYNLSLVATSDSHYVKPEDAHAHDVLLCVQTGKIVTDRDRMSMLDEDYSLKSPQELKKAWASHPEAIDNTQKIAEMCSLELEFGVHRLPRYPLPKGKQPDQELRRISQEGLKTRYANKQPKEAHARLDYELSVIEKTGYASYFLIVADFVNEAKNRGILVGPGRGSAAGSLVSYLTNITNVDPLKYNLLFERFLNPERVSMPDIDLDFADDRRGEVIDYVREKYGHEHVAQIITFGTMAARAAIRDAGRALGFPYSFCDQIAKAIPPFTDFNAALTTSAEFKSLYNGDPQAKRLIDTARKLEGVVRHASTHAAAVVITDKPITEYVPLQLSSTSDGEKDTVTQYAMGPIEDLGLLKMDFLGLKNLTVIGRALKLVHQHRGINLVLDTLPMDDGPSYRLLQEGKTTGVFQLESAGMKRYLKELKPTEFEDIISMVALYRPGPMDSIPDFIAAKHGRKKITYLHPLLQPILEKTYGVIVTQDQVLQIAREFAGFSYAEADILRKAVGKKIKALLDEQRTKFVQGALTNKNIDQPTAEKVWDFIEPFARYGFNRAHAACYALIAYQTAYLKANYPAEFMASLLTSDEGNTDRQAIEVADAVGIGLTVLPPDINRSLVDFSVENNAIRFGLGAIKNVGLVVTQNIINDREKNGSFSDIADLFARMGTRDFNRKTVESLTRAGALDEMAERNQVLENVERLLEFSRAARAQRESGQQDLFGGAGENVKPKITLSPSQPASKEDRLKWEKELLGLYVSEHPLKSLAPKLAGLVIPLGELPAHKGEKSVRIAGVITRISKIITKKGQPMVFAQMEDLSGKAEALVFPSLLEKTSDIWQDGALVIVTGKISDKDDEVKILADKCWMLTEENLTSLTRLNSSSSSTPLKSISIYVPPNTPREKLATLQQLFSTLHSEGGTPIELLISNGGRIKRITTKFRILPTQENKTQLSGVIGSEAVRFVR
ncbi:MAG: DNA polymerase III subunit alpha [Candidatus Andersenbacteria bacterium]|nr:DNA polymerase III subunit alpha [Candidatus Andersenbacteria bacterium]MBI3250513.1 DNA polymerase III subunit alpha [Candidatus Andersenbacteria bacterium]